MSDLREEALEIVEDLPEPDSGIVGSYIAQQAAEIARLKAALAAAEVDVAELAAIRRVLDGKG